MKSARSEQRDRDRDDAKRAGALALDRAIRGCGYTNEHVGELLGVSATRVRRMRSDDPDDLDVVPSIADAILADHQLGERLLAEIRAVRLARHGAPPAVTPEQKLHRASGAASRFAAVVAEKLEDGVLEHHEVPAVEEARATVARELDDVAALFRGKELIR